MQSLPSAAPASFPGLTAPGAHSSATAATCPAELLNGHAAANSAGGVDAITGFADLLASPQSSAKAAGAPELTEAHADSELGSETESPVSKKAHGPNLLLACFLPTVTPSQLPSNENPLTLDPGDCANAPVTNVAMTELASPETPFAAPRAPFHLFASDPRVAPAGPTSPELNESPANQAPAAAATPTAPQAPRTPHAAIDIDIATIAAANTPDVLVVPDALAFKFDFTPPPPADAPVATGSGLPQETASDETPATDLDFLPPWVAAKNSPAATLPARPVLSARSRGELKFLSPDRSEVTKPLASVGTDVAKSPEDIMPTLLKPIPRLEDRVAPAIVAPANASSPAVDFPASEAAPAPTAKAAVQQVAAVMDAEAHAVAPANLKMDFDFGDARVTVRVELRDGTVQAHFHTDSAALQSSLSHEWRVAAAAEPEKFVRFAEPSFHSGASHDALSGQSQDQSRRDSSQSREAREEANSFGSFFRRSRSTARPFAPSILSVTPSALSLSHLNTFA